MSSTGKVLALFFVAVVVLTALMPVAIIALPLIVVGLITPIAPVLTLRAIVAPRAVALVVLPPSALPRASLVS